MNDPLKDVILQDISQLIDSNRFILNVDEFEKNFAEYCNVNHCIGVNSGTTALQVSLWAAGIEPGDEVITVSHTFLATVAAIRFVGAIPVLIDIDPNTYLMDTNLIEEKITEKTKAIIPVHLYGQPCDMDEINSIAKKYNLIVIEDAAQAQGATYKNQKVGSFGDLSTFSFYPGKNLGAFGEAGAIVTNDDQLAEKCRMIRNWGTKEKYKSECIGGNFRMDAIQGIVLKHKLKHLDQWNSERQIIGQLYNKIPGSPYIAPERSHVFHVFCLYNQNRDELREHLLEQGIETSVHYPIPIHKQIPYIQNIDLPVTEKAAKNILSLPIYPGVDYNTVLGEFNVL